MGKLKQEISATVAGNFVAAIVFLGNAIILARVLGPANRGLLSLAMLIPLITSSFCIFGQDVVNMTFAGLYKDKRSSLFQQSLIIALLGAVVSTVIICAFYFWLPISKGRFEQLSPDIVWLSCLVAPTTILSRMAIALVRGVGKITAGAAIHVAQITAFLVMLIIFLVWLNRGLKAAIVVTALYPLVAVVLSGWALRNYMTFKPSEFSGRLFKKSLGFGGLLSLTVFANFLTYRIGHGILGYMVSLEQVGLYVVAIGVAEQLRLLPNSISAAFLPRLANDISGRQSQVPVVFRYTAVISTGSMLVIGMFGAPAMLVFFGWDYYGAIPSFLLLLPGIAVLGAASVLSSDLAAREKPKYSVWIGCIILVVNIVFSFVLIPSMGIAGAALASSIAFITAGVLWLIFYLRESGMLLRQMAPRVEDVKYVFRGVVAIVCQVLILTSEKFKLVGSGKSKE